MKQTPSIILASTSPYRKALLEKVLDDFQVASPQIDETPLVGEQPSDLVVRLARLKALKVAEANSSSWVIGSDQVAVLEVNGEKRILGKPGSSEVAIAQLHECSGQRVTFMTGLCLMNLDRKCERYLMEPYQVEFRALSRDEIISYVAIEQPLNCAGSFKSEGLGIALFSRLIGDDPNALVGLPLIQLLALMREESVPMLV